MKLLTDLYEIYAPSNGEKKIKKFIKRWVRENVVDATIRTDNNDGNVYIVRGDADAYPCVVAHLDQVQRNHSADFKAVETDDIIFGYSPSKRCHEGLGADDKNGIWVALKCLEEFDTIKVAFFVGEEIGCIGSGRCDISWFKDCRYIIEPDRRGASDLITSISGRICSEAFESAINAEWFGYKATSGLMTDVEELCDRGVGVSCINLSCGYYSPHSDEEYTVKQDLINCLNFVRYIISNVTDVYEHKYESAYSSAYGGYYGYGYGSSYYGGSDYFKNLYKKQKEEKVPTQPVIYRVADYADFDSFVDQMMFENHEYFTPDDIYPYIASDLETFEIYEDTWSELAWDYYAYYESLKYEDADDAYAAYWDNQA